MTVQNTGAVRWRWPAIVAILLSGVIAAMQIGKVAIALPTIRGDLGLTLSAASAAIGAYGVLGAALGFPAGLVSALMRPKYAAISGLLISAAASALGGFAPDGWLLVLSRVFEGAGFLVTILSLPTLLRTITPAAHAEAIFALWGAYLPLGVAGAMVLGPAILQQGWRTLWFIDGALTMFAVVLVIFASQNIDAKADSFRELMATARHVVRQRHPMLLSIIFALYAFTSMAMSGLLPYVLVERNGLSVELAGLITAMVLVSNAAGNALTGLLLRVGVSARTLVILGFSTTAVASFAVFGSAFPAVATAIVACTCLGLAGFIPATLFANASRSTGSASALLGVLGLMNQGSQIGSLTGPALVGSFIEHWGWSAANALVLVIAVTGIIFAFGSELPLHRGLRR